MSYGTHNTYYNLSGYNRSGTITAPPMTFKMIKEYI